VTPSSLFLFDISAYLHRAMHVAYGDRVADVNPSDSAFIMHACAMLANTMEQCNVQRMLLVLDSSLPSFRCDWYPAYKAERRAHYPVFTQQAPRFFDAMRRVGVKTLERDRYEADDLIAAMARSSGGGYNDCTIVSSDKDLLMHVGGSVRYYDPMKRKWFDVPDVCEKFLGLSPEQWPDYVGLVGDAGDGIPGVAGFGPKTAAKLLLKFDNLDEIYNPERRSDIAALLTTKQLTTLLSSEADAFMSRRLAAPVPCNINHEAIGNMTAPGWRAVRSACEGRL
jgi:DNA polymerase-1